MSESENPCLFCRQHDKVLENDLAWASYDTYPVSPGHMLVMPKRHVENYFDMTREEKIAVMELVDECKAINDRERQPDGYNVGVNCGPAAGQSVMHVHIHVMPRYWGDMENPRGGVRGVIPDKQKYVKQHSA